MKSMLVVSLLTMLAVPVVAQDQATAARSAAGCGGDNVQFDVKTDKSRHPQGQVPPGKALVYVFEVERTDAQAFKIGAVTMRIGLDGQWVGANHGNTYFYFPVDPGDRPPMTRHTEKVVFVLAKLLYHAPLIVTRRNCR